MSTLPYQIIAFALVIAVASAASTIIGTAQIYAPAVVLLNNTGTLTIINLTVTKGNGTVTIVGPSIIGQSTYQSADTAVLYATKYLNVSQYDYNFTYGIESFANVSGPSAGTAMTLLAVSALTHRPLLTNFTVTGTISADGTVGEIGGVYDKISAAAARGVKFALVPAVPYYSNENKLYLLTQETFGVPLIQVANVSQAIPYAFGYGNKTSAPTSYDFYTNYHVSSLPNASLYCTNGCNESAISALANFTFNMTRAEIAVLSQTRGFAQTQQQMGAFVNESGQLASKGYYYAAADNEFLTYINAFEFANHLATQSDGLSTLYGVRSYCQNLLPPLLTTNNYEYVLGGELRQGWANYSVAAAINGYRATAIDTDGVLANMRIAGEANAWCYASRYMYNEATAIGGAAVVPSPSLNSVALQRIDRAMQYGSSIYLANAENAYSSGNYPLAILDADYAYAITSADSVVINASNIAQEYNATQSIISSKSSTYGVWATQFSNEAELDLLESRLADNASNATSYVSAAYSAALLAQQLGTDMAVIAGNLTPTNQLAVGKPQQYPVVNSVNLTGVENDLQIINQTVMTLFITLVAMLVVVIAMLVFMIRLSKSVRPGPRRGRPPKT